LNAGVLGGDDVEADDFPPSLGVRRGGDHGRDVHHPATSRRAVPKGLAVEQPSWIKVAPVDPSPLALQALAIYVAVAIPAPAFDVLDHGPGLDEACMVLADQPLR